MSRFRKFRLGSSDSIDSRIETGLSAQLADTEDQNTTSASHQVTFPHRSHSEPNQIHTVVNAQSYGQNESVLSVGSENTLVASSTGLSVSSSNRSKKEEDPLGLSLVHGTSERSADVIFVHGLGGSSLKTWSWERQPEVFWPAWIRHEDGLSQLRVFTYGYNANFRESENPLSILDFSKGLLVRMKTYGHGNADHIGVKPIVFVAHSLGGLVVKKALIIGKNDEVYSVMLSKVHAIMFLSTPHKGSAHAKTLNSFLSTMVGTSAKVFVSELETSSTSIEDISEQFRAICTPFQLISMYETLSTKLVSGIRRMLVNKDAGVLNYPRELSVPVDADHHTICKFQSRLDPNYVLTTNLLRQVTQGLEPRGWFRGFYSSLWYAERDWANDNHSVIYKPLPEEYDEQVLETMLGIQGGISEDLDNHLARASPGSCEWLQRRLSFRNWLDDPDSKQRALWLTGLPGTGKSTLAAKTINHIQKAIRCQYHFFSESRPTKRSTAYCLRSIAFQLASVHSRFAERLGRLHKDTNFVATSKSFQVIWDTIFEDVVFKLDFGSTLHWVLDGLDEADSPNVLIRHLTQIQSRTSIKLLLLSRPKRELTSLVGARVDSFIVEPISLKQTMADIRGYISTMAAEVLPKDKRVQNSVIQQIANKAEGSFLWTKLALESLWESWHTEADIEMALGRVPKDMQALYQRMIDNVKSQAPRLQEMAFRVLNWAACAFRPLTIAELGVALQPEFDGFVNLAETVVQICGQFVRVDDGSPAAVGLNSGHDHLAIVCLQYLSQEGWRQTFSRVSEERSSNKINRLAPLYSENPFLQFILQWIQAVALSGNIADIPRSAQYIKLWLRRRRKATFRDHHMVPAVPTGALPDSKFLEDWATDLIRIVGKFGSNLLQSPTSIYRLIPPFCPESAIISRTFHQPENQTISVQGLVSLDWDDNLARLSLGQDEIASSIRCAGSFFFTLISHNGTVVVWHMETCEELRRLCHEEWVTLMETNKTGSLLATGGRFTNRVWDPSSGQQLYKLPKQSLARSISLNFGKSDQELVISYDDCSVMTYRLDASAVKTLFAVHHTDVLANCPRFMDLSPDLTQLAMGFRGRPVLVWDVDTAPVRPARRVIRLADRDRLESGDDVFNSPEVVKWHPGGSSLYILYQDTTLLAYNMIDDTQLEFGDTGAREMVLNSDGSFMLTSSSGGSVSVWGLPKVNLIYRLQSDEFVRDLAFSMDSQRFYDVRGSGCNVWAPDALIRAEESDREETSSSFDGSFVSEAVTEPVFSEDQSRTGRITAIMCDNEDEFFCCGRDDGSVSIHDIQSGERVRKVSNHSSLVDIIAIEWSISRRFIASADDSGKIIAKRLKIKEDGKWAVFALFELRLEAAISQLLFNIDESLLLISTDTSDRVWDVKKKIELVKVQHGSYVGRKWLNNPKDHTQLIWLDAYQAYRYNWANLALVEDPNCQTSAQPGTSSPLDPNTPDTQDAVGCIILPRSLLRCMEAIAWTSIFPYVYFMLRSFGGMEETRITFYAGMLVATFTFCEFLTGTLWARVSDRIGRKWTLLAGSACSVVTALLFGVSRVLPLAVASRAFGGLSNPNVGLVPTCVMEFANKKGQQGKRLTMWTIIEARPLTLSYFSESAGLGGVNPDARETRPNETEHEDIGIKAGRVMFRCLGLSSPDKNSHRYRIVSGGTPPSEVVTGRRASADERHDYELQDLNGNIDSEEAQTMKTSAPKETFTVQVILQIASVSLLAFHKVSSDAIMPTFLAAPLTPSSATQETEIISKRNILQSTSGFDYSSQTIGWILLSQAVIALVVQAKLVPFIINSRMFKFLMLQSIANTASSKDSLARINGASASFSCLSRSLGPIVTGELFTVGLTTGYVGIAFWVLAFVASMGYMESFLLRDHY
ncbi:NACHT and WD domain-containing protein [Apiospora rasikravindrae]|uniref:NACHT and WD domain-containing protein n=1 Tax=Apiospora rasikravindrae TaxID=990691 RepID=A0ABR1SJT1_9PEZI